jgi:uncharacterized protein (TIGR02421 family)
MMSPTEKKLINRILDKIKKKEAMRITLPGNGLINMEKPVPFMVVYRIPPSGKDGFTSRLGKTESSYIYVEDSPENTEIVRNVAEALSDMFKGFLLLEVWLSDKTIAPPFTVHVSQKSGSEVAEKLYDELGKIVILGNPLKTEISTGKDVVAPPYYKPFINDKDASRMGVTLIGVEIAPIYMNMDTGRAYPLVLRDLRAKFSKAIRKGFFEFVRVHTSYNASHFQMLGTTSLRKNVFEIDEELGKCSNLFDFLLLVTPINVDDAWTSFRKSNFLKAPVFHYRPMPIDPELIKRKIYNLPIEDISDPTMAFLFRDKRKEIDRMLDMMMEREKPDFMLTSLQLFGPIDDRLLETAKALLISIDTPQDPPKRKMIKAVQFAKMAERELLWLKQQDPSISTVVRVRDDIDGILVSRGTLNISKNFQVSEHRAFSLLQHEIGTHVVTYYNGKAQPLKLFYIGVPGYEELQEGLAVFSEYLTGGLTPNRLRTIAARVIAVQQMISGSSFVDTFFLLVDKYKFDNKAAFTITMRVYRGGGLTKDAVYLKGLLNIINYIKNGKSLEPLLIGKIRQDYIPVVQELIHRQILTKIPIKPRFLDETYLPRIENIRSGGNVFNMIQH